MKRKVWKMREEEENDEDGDEGGRKVRKLIRTGKKGR